MFWEIEKCHQILWNRRKQITHNVMSPTFFWEYQKNSSNMTESRSTIRWLDVSLAGCQGEHLILASSCVQCQRSSSNSRVLTSSSTFKSFSSHYLFLSSIPPATRCCEEQWGTIVRAKRLSSRAVGPGAGWKPHVLLCWTHTRRGPGSKHPESGVSGRMDG